MKLNLFDVDNKQCPYIGKRKKKIKRNKCKILISWMLVQSCNLIQVSWIHACFKWLLTDHLSVMSCLVRQIVLHHVCHVIFVGIPKLDIM